MAVTYPLILHVWGRVNDNRASLVIPRLPGLLKWDGLGPLVAVPSPVVQCGEWPGKSGQRITWPPKELAGLRVLDVGGTEVTDAGVAELQKALPNCKIER